MFDVIRAEICLCWPYKSMTGTADMSQLKLVECWSFWYITWYTFVKYLLSYTLLKLSLFSEWPIPLNMSPSNKACHRECTNSLILGLKSVKQNLMSVISFNKADFASLSALPKMPTWLGSQQKILVFVSSSIWNLSSKCSIVGFSYFWLSSADHFPNLQCGQRLSQ